MGNWSENIHNRERIVKELGEGQDCAFQLRHLLLHHLNDNSPSPSSSELAAPPRSSNSSYDHLMLKILTSFTEALSSLHNTTPSDHEVCSHNNINLATSSQVIDNDSAFCNDRRSDDSGESTKRPSPTSKRSRASYKRKKTCGSLTRVSPIIEDGHAWRKYGQKDILNAKYPRSYFRCTHKYDQGCKATKQVQRKEEDDDPDLIMYLITYIGNHTCSSFLSPPPNNNYSSTLLIKEETTTTNIPTHHDYTNSNNNNNNVIWKDCLMTFDHIHGHTTTSLDNLVHTIDFTTPHNFQYLDQSEFNYYL